MNEFISLIFGAALIAMTVIAVNFRYYRSSARAARLRELANPTVDHGRTFPLAQGGSVTSAPDGWALPGCEYIVHRKDDERRP